MTLLLSPNSDVIIIHSALGHHLSKVPGAESKWQLPPDADDDDRGFKSRPFNNTGGSIPSVAAYQTRSQRIATLPFKQGSYTFVMGTSERAFTWSAK